MGLRKLEVNVLSACDLKNVKLMGGTMDPYCVVWLSPHSKVSGPVNKGGGLHPTWNDIITLIVNDAILEQGDAAITIEIYNYGKFSDKFIGTASIPLIDVQGTSEGSTGSSKASAYQVRKKSGKYQGVINVTMKASKALSDKKVAARSAPSSIGVPTVVAAGQYQMQNCVPQQQKPRRGWGFGGAGSGLLTGLLLGSLLNSGCSCGGGGGCGGGC